MTPYDQQVSYSREERLALCALLDETGPDAPTLCEGWTTGDLAAHLVLREHRPDAAAGVVGGPLAGYTARVQQRIKARTPFPELVRIIRSGPPRLRLARFMLRKAPVGVELARDDIDTGGAGPDGPAYRITAKNATPAVTVIGSPAELTMWVMGRRAAARVRMDGTSPAVTKLAEANW
jgi:hypothetical protein